MKIQTSPVSAKMKEWDPLQCVRSFWYLRFFLLSDTDNPKTFFLFTVKSSRLGKTSREFSSNHFIPVVVDFSDLTRGFFSLYTGGFFHANFPSLFSSCSVFNWRSEFLIVICWQTRFKHYARPKSKHKQMVLWQPGFNVVFRFRRPYQRTSLFLSLDMICSAGRKIDI